MDKTIFDLYSFSSVSSQQELLELFQEQATLAKLEGTFSEEEYYEIRQILEDPLLLFTHRFFSYYPIGDTWRKVFFQKWEQKKEQQEKNLLSDKKAFIQHYWKHFLQEETNPPSLIFEKEREAE